MNALDIFSPILENVVSAPEVGEFFFPYTLCGKERHMYTYLIISP